jgi:hypothetical protein
MPSSQPLALERMLQKMRRTRSRAIRAYLAAVKSGVEQEQRGLDVGRRVLRHDAAPAALVNGVSVLVLRMAAAEASCRTSASAATHSEDSAWRATKTLEDERV